ncbi:MAG: MATE family efflux transporter [Candidatus Puniceispirillaceae bacterium]
MTTTAMTATALSWRDHFRHNLRLAAPLMIGQLATIGIWTSDTIAMGQINSASLAAGALASRYYQPLFFLALGISLAVGPLVAQGLGAADERQVRRAFRQGMVVALVLGMIAAPLLLIGEEVLVLLGQDPELARLGQPFLIWSSFGLPFMFLSFVLRQFLISHQRPMPQVIALILALAANVALNEALVAGWGPLPAMGLAGIALATSIIYVLLCAGLVAYIALVPPFRASQPFRRIWVMDWRVTVRLLRIGVPIGLTIVAEAGMFIAVTFIIGVFGTAALAAAAIANQIAAVSFMIPIAVAQASTIRVGNYAGAGDRQNLIRSAGATFWIGIGVTLATTLILLIWPQQLISLFLDSGDAMFAEVLAFAVPMMVLTALFQVPDGVQAIAMSVLRGLNDTRMPGLIAIASFWITGVAVGAIAGLSAGWGPSGVWGGLLIGLSIAALLLTLRMKRALHRIKEGGTILVA